MFPFSKIKMISNNFVILIQRILCLNCYSLDNLISHLLAFFFTFVWFIIQLNSTRGMPRALLLYLEIRTFKTLSVIVSSCIRTPIFSQWRILLQRILHVVFVLIKWLYHSQMILHLAIEGKSSPLIHHKSDEGDLRNKKYLVAIK